MGWVRGRAPSGRAQPPQARGTPGAHRPQRTPRTPSEPRPRFRPTPRNRAASRTRRSPCRTLIRTRSLVRVQDRPPPPTPRSGGCLVSRRQTIPPSRTSTSAKRERSENTGGRIGSVRGGLLTAPRGPDRVLGADRAAPSRSSNRCAYVRAQTSGPVPGQPGDVAEVGALRGSAGSRTVAQHVRLRRQTERPRHRLVDPPPPVGQRLEPPIEAHDAARQLPRSLLDAAASSGT
jgi:hypothetical protein